MKRIACERPMDAGVPLARWSLTELHREVLARGLVATISGTTLWRWLDGRHSSVAPSQLGLSAGSAVAERAEPVVDLYARRWEGRRLGAHDYVMSADGRPIFKLGTAATVRRRSLPAARCGSSTNTNGAARGPISPRGTCITRASLAAAKPRTASRLLIALVEQVMAQEPYRSARRVFWITDNGSAHRGPKGDARLRQRWRNLIPVHTPRHANWLNQIEIYFSIVQRKLLTPNEFASLAALEHYLLAFQARYQASATPFDWTFTRADLHQLLTRLAATIDAVRPAA